MAYAGQNLYFMSGRIDLFSCIKSSAFVSCADFSTVELDKVKPAFWSFNVLPNVTCMANNATLSAPGFGLPIVVWDFSGSDFPLHFTFGVVFDIGWTQVADGSEAFGRLEFDRGLS